MSTIPSRTRSLRKPSDATSGRYGRLPAGEGEKAAPPPRTNQSPSRLPIKPSARIASTTIHPPNAGSITSHASMGPPPIRANISKPNTTATGPQRSSSTRRPSDAPSTISSGGLQRAPSTRRPSDAPSTVVSGGIQRVPSTRKPSVTSSTTTSDPIKQDRSRPPLTQSRHLRSGSTSTATSTVPPPTRHLRSGSTSTAAPVRGHTRNKSSSSALLAGSIRPSSTSTDKSSRPSSTDQQKSVRPSSTDLQSRTLAEPPTLQSQPQLSRKANFSTYQQHFSPAKNLAPKPHPAAFLAPPSPSKLPSNIVISAETAKLQNELLQLHLLHKDVEAVKAEWKGSAKRKLGARFQDVVNKHERLVQLEGEEIGRWNASVLKNWCPQGGLGLEEKIQILDEIVTGVWNLGENGGKYYRLVRKFEKWMARSTEILDARERDEGLENDEVVFLEELDRGWKDECLNIGRRLSGWDQHLRGLGMPEEKSNLATVLGNCRNLVGGMLEELETMARIESDAVRMEGEWIKSMNDDGMDEDEADKPVAGAIWRSR